MSKVGKIWRRVSMLLRGRSFAQDLEDEMRLHRDMREQELRGGGLDTEEARYAANRAFGNLSNLRERSSDAWGWRWLEDLWRDVIYACRELRRNPGFTVTAIVTLILGIGATTAIFSVVNTVLLRPLDFSDPGTLMRIEEKHEGFDDVSFTYATFIDFAAVNLRSLAGVAGYRPWSFNLTGDGDPEQVDGAMISANLFSVLGTMPQLGRAFTPAEQRENSDHVVILSYPLWKRRFGGDPGIIGRVIRVNDVPCEVVGVMPRNFEFPDRSVWLAGTGLSQVWAPLVTDDYLAKNRKSHLVKVFGRLTPGVSVTAARSELDAFAQRINEAYPGVDSGMGIGIWNLQQRMTARVRPALLVLLGAVGLMALAACANVANLVLMRNAGRAREFAVRAALGAGHARLLRQSLVESVLLGLCGGGGGILLAFWSVKLIAALGPQDVPHLSKIQVDSPVLVFALALSLVTAVVFGIVPAAQAGGTDPNESLKESAKGTTGTRGSRLRAALVIAELAVALILLAGGGLLVNSFARLSRVSPGFDDDNVLTMSIFLPPSRNFENQSTVAPFLENVVSRVQALPGVVSAGVVSSLPIQGGPSTDFEIAGRPSAGETNPEADVRIVDNNYFSTMRIPLLRGRWFNALDTESSAKVTVINNTMAKTYWPNEDPIGKRITMLNWGAPLTGQVIGVVGDVRDALDSPVGSWFYWPERQFPSIFDALVVRTAGNPLDLVPSIKAAVWSVDPNQSIAAIKTMDQLISDSNARRRMQTALLAIFSGLALLIAIVGTYGVMAYSVSRRSREIGIRMALGAERRRVRNLILGEGLRWISIGVAIGITGALALGGVLRSLVFGVTAHDPMTLSFVILLLGAVALIACYLPARRAMGLEPMRILRDQ